MIKKPVKKRKTCKDCESTDIFKESRCYEHFRIMANERLKKYRKNNFERFKKYDINKAKKAPIRKCVECGKLYQRVKEGKGLCSHKCHGKNWKENGTRKGEKNPGYRNGFYTNRSKTKMSETAMKHYNACRKYRTEFLEKNDYYYCEHCKTNHSLRFETHHIVYASEAPKHKELHNFRNMILLCIECHNKFHGNKRKIRKYLVIERDLETLFNRNLTL